MTKRKPIEMYALVLKRGPPCIIAAGLDQDFGGVGKDEQIVHLIETDPSAEAELRALRRVAKAAQKWAKRTIDLKFAWKEAKDKKLLRELAAYEKHLKRGKR